ncbi:hypothetical protein HO173_009642 [Letharia columbiana]|uniref:Uncharacterized protein n=1 Tax=Letharia columbiana TaxID=112416 RepID=A0A8H6FPD8_9LECA|nr:uncharacterized protein HO173_009642 [Letharia columbiana]KAF6232259.1 hypothetical protein HO173_009642 [Letharia columbiana]
MTFDSALQPPTSVFRYRQIQVRKYILSSIFVGGCNFRHSSSYPEEGSAYPQQYPSINSCYLSHQLPSNYRQR